MSSVTLAERDSSSPKWTPSDVALAQVFMRRGLLDEELYLCWYIQCLIVGKVSTCKFVPDPVDNLNSFLVECLRLYQPVSNEGVDGFRHRGPWFLMCGLSEVYPLKGLH